MRMPGKQSDRGGAAFEGAAEFFRVLARPRLLQTVRALCGHCRPEGCRGASAIAARQRQLATALHRSSETVARDLEALRRIGVISLRGKGSRQRCCPRFELLQRIRAVGEPPRT
jgi:predicted transcriptional regulator